MKFSKLSLLLVLSISTILVAAVPMATSTGKLVVLDATQSKPGRYVFLVDVHIDGKVNVSQVSQIFQVGEPKPPGPGDPGPGPGPGDPGPMPPDPELTKELKDLISKVANGDKKKIAGQLVQGYQAILELINKGDIPNAAFAITAQNTFNQGLLIAQGKATAWKPLTDGLTKITQGVKNLDDVKRVWGVIIASLKEI